MRVDEACGSVAECFTARSIGTSGSPVVPKSYEAPQDAAAFSPHAPGKWLADLFMLARNRLQRAGVKVIAGGGMCTYSDPARFFSYRRNRTTGRMAALIWREA